MNYRQMRGYCLDNKDIHVCGYTVQSILIQDKTKIMNNAPMKSLKLHENSKGIFFNLRGKRIYVYLK